MSDVDSPTVDTDDERVEALSRLPIEPPDGRPGSLADRVGKRREQREQKTTELFDVPGYADIFRVELRVLGGKRRFAIGEAHERVHDEYQKGVRTAADMLLAATIAIHAVVDEEGNTQPAEGMTWSRLAQAADKKLGPETKPRVALLRLLGEEGVIALAEEWIKWTQTRGEKVDRELQQDF